jgi:isopentenyldiphosphate isomerase
VADYPPIQIVDVDDKPTGGASMADAYSKGLIFRVVYILVQDESGRILLQKRAPKVATFANCWDISAAGHVDEGESYEFSAQVDRVDIGDFLASHPTQIAIGLEDTIAHYLQV